MFILCFYGVLLLAAPDWKASKTVTPPDGSSLPAGPYKMRD
jgi:hypothetical protein